MLLRFNLLALAMIAINGVQSELVRHFEFEDILTDLQQRYWAWRSNASNLKTLRLADPVGRHTIEFQICSEPLMEGGNVTLYVDNIRYANDGPSDTVTVKFNGAFFGTFDTDEKWRSGYEWNIIRSSGQIGDGLALPKGVYTLSMTVATDKWGVEFDRITLNAEHQDPDKSLFCGASLTL